MVGGERISESVPAPAVNPDSAEAVRVEGEGCCDARDGMLGIYDVGLSIVSRNMRKTSSQQSNQGMMMHRICQSITCYFTCENFELPHYRPNTSTLSASAAVNRKNERILHMPCAHSQILSSSPTGGRSRSPRSRC